jgi:hypothetical protein
MSKTTMNGSTNGTPAPLAAATTPAAPTTPRPVPAGAFNLGEWRSVTERALRLVLEQHAHARRERARWAREAQHREREADLLRRALSLELPPERAAEPGGGADARPPVPLLPLGVPSPPEMHKGIRAAGGGVGARAGGYLLEVARVRTRCAAELRQPGAGRNARVDVVADGAHALTAEVIDLACKGWASTTISRGLFRLVEDGYLTKVGPGRYALTQAGLDAPPAPFGLALTDPGALDDGRDAAPGDDQGDDAPSEAGRREAVATLSRVGAATDD